MSIATPDRSNADHGVAGGEAVVAVHLKSGIARRRRGPLIALVAGGSLPALGRGS